MILLYLAILGVASSLLFPVPPPGDTFVNQVFRRPFQKLQAFLGATTDQQSLENTTSPSPPLTSGPPPLASLLVDWAKPEDLPDQPEETSRRVNFVHLPSGEDLELSPLKRQITMLSERCLKSDVTLGIAEGVIFELCKVLVDASSPLTGIHVSHALNARQDEVSYLVRGLMQEIMLNALGPSIGVDPSYRSTPLAPPDASAPAAQPAPPHSSNTNGPNAGASKALSVSVSLHVDLDALPALPAQSAEGVNSSFGPILLELPYDLQQQQQKQQKQKYQQQVQQQQQQQQQDETRPSRQEIQERAKTIAQEQNARRQRVATIVLLRSFIAPLLVHSLAHILPSYLSHEFIEDLVEGTPL